MKKTSLPSKLSDAEAEVMRAAWGLKGKFTAAELMEKLAATREWKQTTVFTFLSRLEKKGLIENEKSGKVNVYTPRLTENEYKSSMARQFLEKMHGGSVRNFVATLYETDGLSKKEFAELKEWFDKR